MTRLRFVEPIVANYTDAESLVEPFDILAIAEFWSFLATYVPCPLLIVKSTAFVTLPRTR